MQTKKRSFIETCINTAVGLVINIYAQMLIFPLFDMHVETHENMMIAVIFTVISICRSYVMRRVFNAWEVRIHARAA